MTLRRMWCPHRRPSGRRSGHGSSADEARRAAAERPCHDYAARGSADVRYEAVDSEERRFGPARLGYYRAIRTGGPGYCWRRNRDWPLARLKACEPLRVLRAGDADFRRAAPSPLPRASRPRRHARGTWSSHRTSCEHVRHRHRTHSHAPHSPSGSSQPIT